MIKNIVFDLGNVLVSFKPAEFLQKKGYPSKIRERILNDIFASKEWIMLDNGEINTKETIDIIAMKSSLKKEEIAHIFKLRSELIYPIDQNIKVLPGLRKKGYGLYFLSNFPMDLFEEVRGGYYFFKYFDGGVISAEAKVSKPDPHIYDLLIKKYFLVPEECLYIDDLEMNVRAAEVTGMKGVVTGGILGISKIIEEGLTSNSDIRG